jgi:hypothetical protein
MSIITMMMIVPLMMMAKMMPIEVARCFGVLSPDSDMVESLLAGIAALRYLPGSDLGAGVKRGVPTLQVVEWIDM